jgi:FAD/FMN-containing dehydrogenase
MLDDALPAPIAALKALVGQDGWSDDPARLAPKLEEWRGRWRGVTPLLLLPRSTEEVSRIVRHCAAERIALTPQGGNTGLVGGQIPDGEVLLSLERMNAIREVAPLDDVIVVEAGVALVEVQQAAAEADRFFPLSLASEGSATVGGLVSTNAGGTAVLRYGTMRDLVLGVEAVLPDGSVFQGLKRLRKDNTGYDLKQLLIGAEGTLGVITAAALKLFPVMRDRAVAMVGLKSPAASIHLLAQAKAQSGGGVEAFELISRDRVGAEKHGRHSRPSRDRPSLVCADRDRQRRARRRGGRYGAAVGVSSRGRADRRRGPGPERRPGQGLMENPRGPIRSPEARGRDLEA